MTMKPTFPRPVALQPDSPTSAPPATCRSTGSMNLADDADELMAACRCLYLGIKAVAEDGDASEFDVQAIAWLAGEVDKMAGEVSTLAHAVHEGKTP